MGSRYLEVSRQGFWAAFTGGWFFDPHHGIFCNTFHLYLWLFLLCFPFTIYLTVPFSFLAWALYTCGIAAVFVFIKLINWRLHHMYDTTECFEENGDSNDSWESGKMEEDSKTSETATSKLPTQGETSEGIEMAPLSSSSQRSRCPSLTPPVQCSSRNSTIESQHGVMIDSNELAAHDSSPTPVTADTTEAVATTGAAAHSTNYSVTTTIETVIDAPSLVRLDESKSSTQCLDTDSVATNFETTTSIKSMSSQDTEMSHLDDAAKKLMSRRVSEHSNDSTLINYIPSAAPAALSGLLATVNSNPGCSTMSPQSSTSILGSGGRDNMSPVCSGSSSCGSNRTKKPSKTIRRSKSALDSESSRQSSLTVLDPREPQNAGPEFFFQAGGRYPSGGSEKGSCKSGIQPHFALGESQNYPCSASKCLESCDCRGDVKSSSRSKKKQSRYSKSNPEVILHEYSSSPQMSVKDKKRSQSSKSSNSTNNALNSSVKHSRHDSGNSLILSKSRHDSGKSNISYTAHSVEGFRLCTDSSDEEKLVEEELGHSLHPISHTGTNNNDATLSPTTQDSMQLDPSLAGQNQCCASSKSDGHCDDRYGDVDVINKRAALPGTDVGQEDYTHGSYALPVFLWNTKEANKLSRVQATKSGTGRGTGSVGVEGGGAGAGPGSGHCSTASQPHSHKSSVVGLDWLFSTTDSDSSRSVSPCDSINSTSTLSGEDSTYDDTSPDQHPSYRVAAGMKRHHTSGSSSSISSSHSSNSSINSTRMPSVSMLSPHIPGSSNESPEQMLSRQRSQGAIPKHRHTPYRVGSAGRTVPRSLKHHKNSTSTSSSMPKHHSFSDSRSITDKDYQDDIEYHFSKKVLDILDRAKDMDNFEQEFHKLKKSLVEMKMIGAVDQERPSRRMLFKDRDNDQAWRRRRIRRRRGMTANGGGGGGSGGSSAPATQESVDSANHDGDTADAMPSTSSAASDPHKHHPTHAASLPLSSSRESYCSNHTEASALLPSYCSPGHRNLPSSQHPLNNRFGDGMDSSHSVENLDSSRPPEKVMAALLAKAEGNHLALSHDDTSQGAMHWFQDRSGKWFAYTFGENSTGLAEGLSEPKKYKDKWVDGGSSSDSSSTAVISSTNVVSSNPRLDMLDLSLPSSVINNIINRTSVPSDNSQDKEKKPKNYYKFTLLPAVKHYRVYFDRLALLALLDRNTVMETFMCILLAVGVSVLGALLLSKQFYNDFWIFSFCFTMASSQYSLLKSTQPDSASPMHGYNRIITFSRPFYFCLCASLVLVLDYAANNWSKSNVVLYTLPISTLDALVFARTLLVIFLLSFPVIFLFGLLPQVNTFCMFVLEQAEIHVFGGNATTSLTAAAFTVMRSCVAVAVLYGFCYAGLQEAESSQHIVFSIYCGICIPVCYHLSRSSSCASVIWSLVTDKLWPVTKRRSSESDVELIDPLPTKLKQAVYDRLRNDLIVMCCTAVFVFAVHVSTAFSSPVLQPMLFDVLVYISAGLGILLHYIIPQLRKEMPWLCCSHPILPNRERDQFEVKEAAHVTIFEICYVWLRFFERNIVYSVVFMSALTTSARQLVEEEKFSLPVITLIVVICSMKMMRSAFNATQHQYLIILFTFFFFKYDFQNTSETFLVDYFFMSIVYHKFYELILKVRFVITYIAPWQITWGSAFHAFAQPLSVPHSAILFFQTFVSAVFSTPLNPVLGSALFIISYVRPTKFWERDYNTRRVDNTNTRLSSQLERNPGADDNNLNSIFYEHLTRSLQHSLCGDLMLGRWGNVKQGDCFIIASDYLNALVHIIEMGNGLVTFQLRGLEFRGTYCQQREVEAITEGLEEDEAFCCCEPGHLPHCLSVNAAFNQRWLAWQVIVTKYVIEGYSISDNSAASMLQVYDLRKVLLTYYVKSIIYYTVRSPKLEHWLNNQVIREGLKDTLDKSYVDLDPTFSMNVDEDYDLRLAGVSKSSFCLTYLEWIQYCASRREKNTIDSDRDSWLVSLCFGLSLLGRRTLGSASHNNASASVDFFLYGLHALFKGDFRITSPRDEWVFSDMELLRRVVAPGIRMSLKLHQDHFTFPDEYDNNSALYEAISSHENSMVISHENDPSWRNAVLSNVPSLLALRHVLDEGSDEYKIIMLNKRYLSFRVIKVNRECVRGLWAGQQQELVFLRNRDPERGSIQNAKQALRNMINSSCDQPIGYPIYVSPLTTSYSGTNNQLSAVLGKEFTLNGVIKAVRNMWTRLRLHCGATCASGSAGLEDYNMGCNPHFTSGMTPCTGGAGGNLCHPGGGGTLSSGAGSGGGGAVLLSGITDPHQLGATRGSTVSSVSSISKPSSALVSIAGLTTDKDTPTPTPTTQSLTPYKVQIVDPSCVYDNVNLGRRIDVQWPNDEWRMKGGKNNWGGWTVERGAIGVVVHRWQPCHREIGKRSHVDRTIVLVQIGDRYVPIAEAGVTTLDANPSAHAATPTGGVGGGDSGGFTGSVTADV